MEKLKKLPLHWQLLALIVTAGLLYYGFYSFFVSPIETETAQVNEQAAALQSKNEQARIVTQRIEEFRRLYAAKTAEYDELKVLLPEEREITNVLQGLQETAHTNQLTLMRFTPRDDAPYTPASASAAAQTTAASAPAPAAPAPANSAAAKTPTSFITAKPVEIEVYSNFSNLKSFYRKMAQLQRIVSISDFGITQINSATPGSVKLADKSKTIAARFTLTAYYATPEAPAAPVAALPAAPAAVPPAPPVAK